VDMLESDQCNLYAHQEVNIPGRSSQQSQSSIKKRLSPRWQETATELTTLERRWHTVSRAWTCDAFINGEG